MNKLVADTIYFVAAAFVLVLCGLILMGYGWSLFATLTQRPGLNGDMHSYYRMSITAFSLYNAFILLVDLLIAARLILFFYRGNTTLLKRGLIHVFLFFLLIIICESLLSMRFTGKG